ncbi:hypothetical protein HOF56_03780 [Candidatus Peribacteria bacterium]|jgi:hypothetical protein|nr:hypothetical protein [Candidatus Peribacteria bacterium]MBT4020909.1 hypothetical protein [Candidatus Peribacteria bacterium]MBT4240649.1 hypothetical protein [Candidatus Peribacteria bacterium]
MSEKAIKFLAQAKKIKLSDEEMLHVRESLVAKLFGMKTQDLKLHKIEKRQSLIEIKKHMRDHPMQNFERRSIFNFFSLKLPAAVMIALLLISSGGVAAYAAEDSVPGEILYPVKIYVNEPLIERLHINPEKRARWSMRRLERRLEEAEMSAEKKVLTEDVLEHLERRIEHRKEKMEHAIERIENEDEKETIRENFDEMMKRREKRLEMIKEKEVPKEEMKKFIKKVELHRRDFIGKKRMEDRKAKIEYFNESEKFKKENQIKDLEWKNKSERTEKEADGIKDWNEIRGWKEKEKMESLEQKIEEEMKKEEEWKKYK